MKRCKLWVLLISLFFSLTYGIYIISITRATKIWIVDDDGPADFSKIQDAVDMASSGDTIQVRNGIYYENVNVDKTLTLIGENNFSTIIDGLKKTVINICANNIEINGFTIQNGWSGIYISGYNESKISNNIITSNIGTGMGDGVYIRISYGNVILNNKISNNFEDGLTLARTTDNIIKNNIINLNGNVGLYIHESANRNNIYNNDISSNGQGGYNNGIFIGNSNENTIIANKIESNTGVGIYLHNSYENLIYHNNIVNNEIQAYDDKSNIWDNGYPSGGNYWNDYAGRDVNEDGIGDTMYVIDGDSNDNYPIMNELLPHNEAPIAEANGHYLGEVDTSISFSSSGSYDPDGIVETFRWEFGDGGVSEGGNPSYAYSVAGNFTVTLTVIDNMGAISTDTTYCKVTARKFSLSVEHIAALVTIGGAASGIISWMTRTQRERRRKQVLFQRLMEGIDEVYTRFKMNAMKCETELYRYKDQITDEFKRGMIDEENFRILENRIDEYVIEIRKEIERERHKDKT